MNYLAHVFLAENNDESIIGNFLGDFVKGRLTDQYNPEILKGIITHRKIDAYTDSHVRVKNCRRLISEDRRRWSGVIIDILFDYFLSLRWDDYSNEDLDDFIAHVYDILLRNEAILPENSKQRIISLVTNNWFSKYRTIEGLSKVFEGLSKRVRVKNTLNGAEKELVNNFDELSENFDEFFPQLIDYVDEVRIFI
ncbi:MAG: DUF479 domain-containing protein [Candidatus Dadabacteria bacterium]|nr:DUF479 domain-containing protein [Candidatus Dadabacteria bacterium]NIQ15770.1 DUF479 domain-containing protein [Candidatus Dadabacteria bacterium]